jgi:hypothetical protein
LKSESSERIRADQDVVMVDIEGHQSWLLLKPPSGKVAPKIRNHQTFSSGFSFGRETVKRQEGSFDNIPF